MDLRIKVLKWSHIVATYAIWLMVTYLTDVWELSIINAAGIVNLLTGTGNMLQIVFAFIDDELTGKYLMLLLSSIAYATGLGFLCMSTPPVLATYSGNCAEYKSECIGQTQKVLFYTSLALIATGISGLGVSINSFSEKKKIIDNILREDNKNGDDDLDFYKCFKSCFLAGIGTVASVILGILLPYTKSWKIQFGIPAICTLSATLLFISGSRSYKSNSPRPKDGSPLKIVFRVFVASASKIFRQLPSDDYQLYGEKDDLPYPGLSFLDKAAIITSKSEEEEKKKNKWTLCSVTDVETAKQLVRIAPFCLTFVISGTAIAVGNTYFVEQANHLNRKMGSITVPLSVFLGYTELSKSFLSLCLWFYSWFFEYMSKQEPKDDDDDEKDFREAQLRVGGIFMHILTILTCITAAKVEMRRLHAIRKHDLIEKPEERIPMSVFWLLPQFTLLAYAEMAHKACLSNLFTHHAPSCMKEYSHFFYKGVMGVGAIGSVLLVFVSGRVSEREGKPNWFQHTLNQSRLDHYYWMLSGLCAVSFIFFYLSLCFYSGISLPLEEPKEVPLEEVS